MAKKEPKSNTDKFSLGHHMGERYGYDVDTDGAIRLAPILTDEISALMNRKIGLRQLLRAVNEYAAEEFTRISKQEQKWWKEVDGELGLDGKSLIYLDGKITRKQPDPPADEKAE